MEGVIGDSKFTCCNCKNLLAYRQQLFSKAIVVKSGQAYLFSNAMNVVEGPEVEREFVTGVYTIAGISCSHCAEALGWKYIKAPEMKEKYKEGKFVLEKSKLAKVYH